MALSRKLKRLLALLIVLLAILLGVASLFTHSRWLPVFSWGVMALSLGLALAALVQSDRQQFRADPARLHRRIRLDMAGLLLSTAAAVLAGREVLRLVPESAASAGVLLALVLSFVAGFAAAALVQFLFSRAARCVSQA
jgi:putative flippase GtrA